VNTITSETFAPLPKRSTGRITTLGKEIDEAYMQRLETLILDPQIIREAKSLRIVYFAASRNWPGDHRPILHRSRSRHSLRFYG